ncbi:MAG: hypothetical protein HY883_00040 [Deltaproteobacteria bacterium]|nr:hypothetical protein [Deltaproteobacteria bacterium]
MKDFFIFLPLTVVYLAFKAAVFPSLPLPDITLLIVLFVAQKGASVGGALLSFVLGYVDDVFSGAIIGSTSFALALTFGVAYLLSRKVHFSTVAAMAIGSAGLDLFKWVLILAALGLSGVKFPFMPQILLTVTVTGFFAPVILPFFRRLSATKVPGAQRGGER